MSEIFKSEKPFYVTAPYINTVLCITLYTKCPTYIWHLWDFDLNLKVLWVGTLVKIDLQKLQPWRGLTNSKPMHVSGNLLIVWQFAFKIWTGQNILLNGLFFFLIDGFIHRNRCTQRLKKPVIWKNGKLFFVITKDIKNVLKFFHFITNLILPFLIHSNS